MLNAAIKDVSWQIAAWRSIANAVVVLFFGVAFAIFSLLQNGLGLYPWIQNGFQRAIKLSRWAPQYDNDVWLPFVKAAMFKTLSVWYVLTSGIYERPQLYMVCAIALFAAIFYAFYFVGATYFEKKYEAVAATVLIAIGHSYITSNGATIGVWNSVYFADTAVMACVVTLSICAMLTDRVFLASIGFSVAVQLHLFNGLSVFIYIFVPYLLLGVIRGEVRNSIILCLCPLATVLIALFSPLPTSPIENSSLTLSDWIKYCYFRDPDDVLLTYSMVRSALPVAAATVAYIALRANDKPLCFSDAFMICFSAVSFSAVAIEFLHSHGITFGKLSELFTAVQLRRGMWVFHLIASYSVLASAYVKLSSRITICSASLIGFFVLNLYHSEVQVPTVVIVLAVLDMSSSGCYLKASLAALYALSFVGLVPLIASFGGINFNFDVFSSAIVFVKPQYFLFSLCVAAFVFALDAKFKKFPASSRKLLLTGAVVFSLSFSVYAMSSSAIHNARYALRIFDIEKLEYAEMLHLYSVETGADESAYENILEVASGFGKDGKVLLPPRETNIDPTLLAGVPLLLFEFYDRAFCLYSFRFAREYDTRLRAVFGQGIIDLYHDDFLNNFTVAYNSLSSGRMAKIMSTYGVSAVITTKPFRNIDAVYSNGSFWIYSYADISGGSN